jgi:hypothetical protein
MPTASVVDWSEELLFSLLLDCGSSLQYTSDMALSFVGGAIFIRNLYDFAPAKAGNRNVANAADLQPRLITTLLSPCLRTSMTYGCLNMVGVAVGMLDGDRVSPGANGAREEGSSVLYGDGSSVSSAGVTVSSSKGASVGDLLGNVRDAGDVGSELGSDVANRVGGVSAEVVGVTIGVDGAVHGFEVTDAAVVRSTVGSGDVGSTEGLLEGANEGALLGADDDDPVGNVGLLEGIGGGLSAIGGQVGIFDFRSDSSGGASDGVSVGSPRSERAYALPLQRGTQQASICSTY